MKDARVHRATTTRHGHGRMGGARGRSGISEHSGHVRIRQSEKRNQLSFVDSSESLILFFQEKKKKSIKSTCKCNRLANLQPCVLCRNVKLVSCAINPNHCQFDTTGAVTREAD